MKTLVEMPLAEIEAALAAGHIWAEMSSGRYWRVRRNGKTKLWKTRPNEFCIPVKAGLRECGYLRDANLHFFIISQGDPNK